MINKLLNNMRFQAAIGQNILAQVRLGIVTSYNPANPPSVQVNIQPKDDNDSGENQSGWIPIATNFIGQIGAPKIGDQVIIIFQEGNINNGIVIGKLYSDEDTAPQVPSGEWWLIHQSGSFIKIKNNGDIDIHAESNINITSPLIKLSDNGTLKKLVTEAMVEFFNNHTHGNGPFPDQQMSESELTTIVTAE